MLLTKHTAAYMYTTLATRIGTAAAPYKHTHKRVGTQLLQYEALPGLGYLSKADPMHYMSQ